MSGLNRTLTELEVEMIAMEHINNNPSTIFNYQLVSITYDVNRHPS
ncbi:hypothetical protein PAECIP111891_07053 [Paenibacillus allorhizoplanae]|uniref:Uncharacterized protein n=1 Tax=Paenibacillus allorhizoplanae TaxID=2905648 RepID=A0ABN8H6X8_9BACL|nr:hypothetical protein [Paenibacillus allorhizoplanae]CAH1232604.1 hypothetical protein PAECIP111891_07053 [Paenibacillus allorhizoplanae]